MREHPFASFVFGAGEVDVRVGDGVGRVAVADFKVAGGAARAVDGLVAVGRAGGETGARSRRSG